jgi:hypothetical protein
MRLPRGSRGRQTTPWEAANMSHFGSATSLANNPGLLVTALIALAAALAACAQQQSQQEARAAPEPQRPAYCEPRPAPDCEFRQSTLKTVDPAEFTRLKVAYQRRCIRHAGRAERARMRELQASGACEGRPAPSLATSR